MSQRKNIKQAELIRILNYHVGTVQKKKQELAIILYETDDEINCYKSFVSRTFIVQYFIIITCIGTQLFPLLFDAFNKSFTQ